MHLFYPTEELSVHGKSKLPDFRDIFIQNWMLDVKNAWSADRICLMENINIFYTVTEFTHF